jgi:FkbM family methyltransferase
VVFKLKLPAALDRQFQIRHKYHTFRQFAPAIGKRAALRLAFWDRKGCLTLQPKGISKPLVIRSNSSDIDVFWQIFCEKEYSCLANLADVDLIIDAGANVGYSSVYFLSHFPDCKVIAIEPDGNNFASLQRNLAPYGQRAQALKCGIWSKSAELAIEDANYRDGRDWTRQVRECEVGETGDIKAVTVADLLLQSGRNRLSLLKMDIEGAEAVVFADPSCQQWLPKTEAIAIELHDDSGFGPASDLFHAAIRDQHYQISHSGELTICLRTDPAGG